MESFGLPLYLIICLVNYNFILFKSIFNNLGSRIIIWRFNAIDDYCECAFEPNKMLTLEFCSETYLDNGKYYFFLIF